MRRWWLYRNNRKTVATLLREEPREIQDWIAEGDEELRELLELDASGTKQKGLLAEQEKPQQTQLELN